MDPSPRISVLHALSSTSNYTSALPPLPTPLADPVSPKHPETPTKKLKRRVLPQDDSPPPPAVNEDSHDSTKRSYGDIKDLEILYNLWKGAGKSVNLWDWLQGYLGSFSNEEDGDGDGEVEEGEVGVDEGDEPARVSLMRKRKRAQEEEQGKGKDDGNGNGNEVEVEVGVDDQDKVLEEEKRDRLHASFVRFCEEARMLGMVRARGKGVGRRADEVVKGVTLV